MTICHNYHRVHPRLRGVRLEAPLRFKGERLQARAEGFPAGTLEPAQILTAYGFKQNQFAGVSAVKLGVGSLGGGVPQADIDAMCAAWGMPQPKITIRSVDGASPNAGDQDSTVENLLDLLPTISFAVWWLTGSVADVTISFGPNATGGMEAVVRDLMAAGVSVMSWSWGSAESSWDPVEKASLSKAFQECNDAGVTVVAASGDNSIDDGTSFPSADYPAGDPCVWAVGGTHLSVAADGSKAAESAWGDGLPGDEGGGGGYDPSFAVPPYQAGFVAAGAAGRGVPDTAANADPTSGWIMSANGSWTVVGGTSASAPFTAALIAVAKAMANAVGVVPTGLLQPRIYAQPAGCSDITTGSNGDAAAVGWDPATGLGSPNGGAFMSALAQVVVATAPTQSPPPPVVSPPIDDLPPPASPAPVVVTVDDAVFWAGRGIDEEWPTDGRTPDLSEVQSWASAGLAEHWPNAEGGASGGTTTTTVGVVAAVTEGIVMGVTKTGPEVPSQVGVTRGSIA